MTKAELIARIASRKDLPRTLSKKAFARIIDAIFTEVGDYFIRARPNISNPPKLTYPGFGTFTKRRRTAREVRNPQTGEPISIPAQSTIVFTPGQELRSLLGRDRDADRLRVCFDRATMTPERAAEAIALLEGQLSVRLTFAQADHSHAVNDELAMNASEGVA